MSTTILRPNGDDSVAWTPSSGTDNYALVDEVSADDDSSYVSGNIVTPSETDIYTLADPGSSIPDTDTINSVKVYWRARHTAFSGTFYIKPLLKLGATTNVGTQEGASNTYANFNQIISKPGGGSWTKTDITNLKVGVENVDTKGAGEFRVTQVYVEVDHSSADLVITPDPVTLVATRVNPTVSIGSITLTPAAATLVTTTVSPTVQHGSVTITPSPATLVTATVSPTVSAGGNVEYLYPNASGYHSQWPSKVPTGDEFWQCVDEVHSSPDDDSSYIYKTLAATHSHTFNITQPQDVKEGVTITAVKLHWRCKHLSSGDKSVYGLIRRGTSESQYGPLTMASGSYHDKEVDVTGSRPGGGSWLWSDFADLQIGLKCYGQTSSAQMRCTQVYLEVQFTPQPNWYPIDYAFRREITFPTNLRSSALTTDDVFDFEFQTGFRERIATNGCFNEAVQESGHMHVYYQGKTHVAYLSRYESSSSLHAYVVTRNHATGAWGTPVDLGATGNPFDTHRFPIICVDNSGYLHVFYGSHGAALKYKKSTNVNDSGAWTTMSDVSGEWTYPIVFVVPSDGRICIVGRGGVSDTETALSYSDNGGTSWTGPKTIVLHDAGNAYRLYTFGCRFNEKTERLHIAFSFIKTDNITEGVWYAYSDYTGTGDGFVTWKKIDGTTCGTLESSPITRSGAGAVIVNEASDLWLYFCRTLVLTKDGDPIVYWSEFDHMLGPNSDAGVGCSIYKNSAWQHYRFHEGLDLKMRTGRCGIPGLHDVAGNIHSFTTIGPRQHRHFKPTADGFHTNINTSSGSDKYAMVDDGRYKHDGDTTYLHKQGVCEASFTSSETIPDGLDILGVGVELVGKNNCSNPDVRALLRISSVDYESASELNVVGSGGGYHFDNYIWENNPATSQPWTKAEIQGLEFGFKQKATGTDDTWVTQVTLVVAIKLNSDDEYGSSEIVELLSDDKGETWSYNYLTGNSAIGVPILSINHHLTNQMIELVWTSGYDVFYLSDERYGKIRRDGRDLRVMHDGDELDRLIDYANFQTTRITINIPETIAADQIRGTHKMWLYYGNPGVSDHRKGDPHAVFPWGYEGFESLDRYENIHGKNGWSVVSGTAAAYYSPPDHSNKVYEGIVAAKCSSGGGTAEKDQASNRSDLYVEAALWSEGTDTRIYLAMVDAAGTNINGVGVHITTSVGEYSDSTGWHDSTIPANANNMIRVAISLEGGNKMSAWVNGVKIANEVTSKIANCKTIRLVIPIIGFFDGITTRKRLLGNVVELISEEARGLYVGATIQIQSEDTVEVDAQIDTATADPSGQAIIVVTTVNPTIILSDIVCTPSPVSMVTTGVDPTVILGDVVVPPSPASLITTVIAPTVVMSSITYTPASISLITATQNPDIVLSSITITPAAATLITSVEQPTLIMSSITIVPPATSLITSVNDPVIVLSSMAFTPPILSLITSSIDPTVVLGSIIVTPNASTLICDRINPTVILGSIIIEPTAGSLVATVVDPVIVMSSITLQPAAVSAVALTITPTVILDSMVITPPAISAVTSTIDPTLHFSSTTTTPNPATLVVSVIDPTVSLSDVIIQPAPATLVTGTVDPGVILGDISITPDPAVTLTSGIDPTLFLSSITTTPSPVSLICAKVDPTVVYGLLLIEPPPVTLVTGKVDPLVILGSVVITPNACSLVTASEPPELVFSGMTVSPAPSTLVIGGVDPTVIVGDAVIEPAPATLVCSGVDPNVVMDSMTMTPDVCVLVTDRQNPTVILGSITISPAAATLTTSGVDPNVIAGDMVIVPTPVTLRTSSVDPLVIQGDVTVTPAAATLVAVGVDPTILYDNIIIVPSAASLVTGTVNPTVVLGSVSITPNPAVLLTSGVDPFVVQGGFIITPEAATLVTSVVNPGVRYGSVSIVPDAVSLVTGGNDPTVVLSSISITPEVVTLVTDTGDVLVILGDCNITPAAALLICGGVDPTLVFGSMDITPDPVWLVTSGADPVVQGILTIVPAPAYLIAAGVDPNVLLQLLLTPPAVSLVCVGVDPAVIKPPIAIRFSGQQLKTSRINGATIETPGVTDIEIQQATIDDPDIIGG